MPSPHSEIKLYKCHKCAAPYMYEWVLDGVGCRKCASRQIQPAPPTFRYVSAWLRHHPTSIPRYFKENILRWV